MMDRVRTGLWLALACLAVTAPAHGQMSLPGKFEVTDTGSASYTIPISVVPGTAGLEPKLSLQYDSRSGNGLLGVGWSLAGLPAITRCGRTIAQDGQVGGVGYDANDRFCLDGQRLVAISGTYGADQTEYRTERESFSKVISYGQAGSGPSHFKVWTKAGLIMEFGNSADSRIEAQGKQSVRVWAINKTQDTKGNYFTVSYLEDNANGEYRPDRIDYTGNAAANTQPTDSVRFVYETRPDIVPLYQAGSLIRTTQRMTKVQAWQGSSMVREYRLAYEVGPETHQSRLVTATRCSAVNMCLPSGMLSWSGQLPSYSEASYEWRVPSGWCSGCVTIPGDFNGDGKLDIYFFNANTGTHLIWINRGDGTFNTSADYDWRSSNGHCGLQCTAMLGDFNGDGKTDIYLWVPSDGKHVVWLNQGNGSFNDAAYDWTSSNGHCGSQCTAMLGDFNGDGKTDIYLWVPSDGKHVVWLNRGNGSFNDAAYDWTSSNGHCGLQCTAMLGDFNGDGKTDIYLWVPSDGKHVVWLNQGNGSFNDAAYDWTSSNGHCGLQCTAMLGDFNGDGKTDIYLWVPSDGKHVVWLNRGNGSFNDAAYDWTSSNGHCGLQCTAMLGDFNGDGLADIYLNVAGGGHTVWLNKGRAPDLIASIGMQNGSLTKIVLESIGAAGAPYAKDTGASACAYPCVDVQGPLYVVSEVKSSNGLGGEYRSTYRYAGAKSDQHGRGFLGFRQMIVKDEQTLVEQVTTYRQDYPFTGLVASRDKKLGAQLLNRSSNTYDATDPGSGSGTSLGGTRRYPFLTQSLEESWELSGTALPAVTTTYQYDTYGNATEVSVSTGDGHGKTTTNTYANDTAAWLLGRLQRSVVTSTTPAN